MRSLIVNYSDVGGGAATAAGGLHRALGRQGIDSNMAVYTKSSNDDPKIHVLPRGSRAINRVLLKSMVPLGFNDLGTLSTFALSKANYFKSADVINFHLLHGGYFNILALPFITKNKPSILTLHDMWSFTGHCVYSFDCLRWKTGCGKCPYPKTYPPISRDATKWEWKLKRWSYNRAKIHIIAISRWMEELLKESMLRDCPTHCIPNGIDLSLFRPRDAVECRYSLGLRAEGKFVLFSAADLKDRRKGCDLLVDALSALPETNRNETTVLIMGKSDPGLLANLRLKYVEFGFVENEGQKCLLYNAADVFAFPTRADNLPLVLQESMACGTPIVSFNVGGVADLVRSGETGFAVPPESVRAFSERLAHVLSNDETRQYLGRRCREIALSEYSIDLQARRYIELFEQLAVRKKNAGASV